MGNKLPFINLLKRENINIFDKFIGWALTIGRVVVIITEIIALGAFLYRFSLDDQLIKLHDDIKKNVQYVEAQKTDEQKYRTIQGRLSVIASLDKQGKQLPTILKDFDAIIPKDGSFTYNSITISSDTIKIDANAKAVSTISTFIAALKKNPHVASISLDRIENKITSATIVANITARLKKEQK